MEAEIGAVRHKLRHLAQLDRTRIQLIRRIAIEQEDLQLGDCARHLFDLDRNPEPNEVFFSKDVKVSNGSAQSEDILTRIDAQLEEMKEMKYFLETQLQQCLSMGKVTPQQLVEVCTLIEMSKSSPSSTNEDSIRTSESDQFSKIIRDEVRNLSLRYLSSSPFRELQSQWEVDISSQIQELDGRLNELRKTHKDVLFQLLETIRPYCPYEIKVTW